LLLSSLSIFSLLRYFFAFFFFFSLLVIVDLLLLLLLASRLIAAAGRVAHALVRRHCRVVHQCHYYYFSVTMITPCCHVSYADFRRWLRLRYCFFAISLSIIAFAAFAARAAFLLFFFSLLGAAVLLYCR